MTTSSDSAAINPLDLVRMLRTAGAALFTQAAMHGELARIDWAEEKTRLSQMLLVGVIGFAGLLCVMLFAGALVLAISWDTTYRIQAALALLVAYGLVACFAWSRLEALSARGSQAFAATREELAADLAMLKSKL